MALTEAETADNRAADDRVVILDETPPKIKPPGKHFVRPQLSGRKSLVLP
jgi:hypothetical protein